MGTLNMTLHARSHWGVNYCSTFVSFCVLIGDSGIVRQVQESHSLQEFHDDLSLKRQVRK